MLASTSPFIQSVAEVDSLKSRMDACCYDSIRQAACQLDFAAGRVPGLAELNELVTVIRPPLCNAKGRAIRFVPQVSTVALSAADYESNILASGEVPSRDGNWHDTFNALVWLTFPNTKSAINVRHVAAWKESLITKSRGPLQDALTLFDECGVIVASDREDLLELIRNFSWQELFWTRRREVQQHMKFITFGHGLMEQLLVPYVGLTGKALLLKVESAWLQTNQDELLQHMDATTRAVIASPGTLRRGQDLAPLPVLGIPGWAVENEQQSYYDHRDYFRAGRRANTSMRT